MLSFSHPVGGSCEGEESSPQLKPVNMCERRWHLTENGTKGVKSRKLAIAIRLSKARQDGVNVRRKTRAG